MYWGVLLLLFRPDVGVLHYQFIEELAQEFDVIWLITGSGGIGFYTKTLPIHTFMKTFGELQVGAGAALSMMMFLMLVVFALIYFKLYKRDEHI